MRGELKDRAWLSAAGFADAPATIALADAAGLREEALADLSKWNLVHFEGSSRWLMHPLVRDFGRRAGDEESRRGAQGRFLDAYVHEAEPMDFRLGFRRYQRDKPHFDRGIELVWSTASRGYHSRLLTGIARAQSSLGEFETAKELLEHALKSDIEIYGPEHPDVATRRSHLGRVFGQMGEVVQAKDLLLESHLRTFGPEHPKVVDARKSLGSALLRLGELNEASTHFEQVLRFSVGYYREDHP